MNSTNTANYFFFGMFHYHYVNSHNASDISRNFRTRGRDRILGVWWGLFWYPFTCPIFFVVGEVSRMNIWTSIEVYASSAVNANKEWLGTGTASAFACVLNRSNVKEVYKATCRRYQSMHRVLHIWSLDIII